MAQIHNIVLHVDHIIFVALLNCLVFRLPLSFANIYRIAVLIATLNFWTTTEPTRINTEKRISNKVM